MNSNLKLWNAVEATPPSFIKAGQKGLSSINSHSFIKRATEHLGMIGLGWGYDIIEERYDNGAPAIDKASGEVLGHEINHTIKIKFWYKADGQIASFEQYGHTPYIMKTKYGLMSDEEAPKKSLTDAIKKSLSMLGFSADVWLGLTEDASYKMEQINKEQLEKAEDKDAEQLRQIEEYKAWKEKAFEVYATPMSGKALQTIYNGHIRRANSMNDKAAVKAFTDMFNSAIQELKNANA